MSRAILGFCIGVALLFLSACGQDQGSTSSSDGQSAGAGPSAPIEVAITLTDYAVSSPVTTFTKGQAYKLAITNKGQVNHELVIFPPLVGTDHRHGLALAEVPEKDLPPATTVIVEHTFSRDSALGTFELACHLPGHYDQGMKLPIAVQ